MIYTEAQYIELGKRFSFPEIIEFEHLKDIFKLCDINNVKELK